MPVSKRLKKNLSAVAVSTVLLGSIGSMPASAADLIVAFDQSQLLRLPRPVAEVIIGNPSIADVAVQGGNMLVITGKSFGVTNIIALDGDRNVIQDQRVIVDQDDRRTVALYRGSLRQTYTCAPNCSPALIIGDDLKVFDSIAKAAQAKRGSSTPARQQSPE